MSGDEARRGRYEANLATRPAYTTSASGYPPERTDGLRLAGHPVLNGFVSRGVLSAVYLADTASGVTNETISHGRSRRHVELWLRVEDSTLWWGHDHAGGMNVTPEEAKATPAYGATDFLWPVDAEAYLHIKRAAKEAGRMFMESIYRAIPADLRVKAKKAKK